MAKADLHLHSRFSDRAADWVLRRFGVPESYSEPRALYGALRAAGMDFVTLTDHDRISGCLEIAELPGVIIGEEVSANFPEDGCKVHVLVWGLNARQHGEIQGLRQNLYDLARYLSEQSLAHAVAHPLYRVDDRLGPPHFQKLALLFKAFEAFNGHRDVLWSETARFVLGALTPETLARWSETHGIEPTHERPWEKTWVGGSDDHGGLFPGETWTETPPAADASEFLGHIVAGRCKAGGREGDPVSLSHGVYGTVYSFAQAKFSRGRTGENLALVEKMFSRFMEGNDPTRFTWTEKLGFLAQGIQTGKIFDLVKPEGSSLWKQLATYFNDGGAKAALARETAGVNEPERRAFLTANLFANQLAFRFFTRFVADISSGNIIESVQHLSAMLPLVATLGPYIYAFKSQVPSQKWLREFCRKTAGAIPPALLNGKRAWFTDTLEDVNGVANTIRKMTAAGIKAGKSLAVVTSRTEVQIRDIPIRNFAPIGEFELPEYELQKLSFPPVLQILDYIHRERFTELIISTPGPVGLTALLAANLFGLRTVGIYHTDFPQYVRILTDDSFLETLTWNYMHWFYSQLDIVYVNSEQYRQSWIARGIAPEKLRILPRGLDNTLFHPQRREPAFFRKFGAADGAPVVLYVGRVSKEKDLDVLADAWRALRSAGVRCHLAFVGDGPYLAELQRGLPGAIFTGYLAGLELAKAFASADAFAFPSTTDTFGNVILEAMASGLPCVVSDQGGPRELVADGTTGFITRGGDSADFARGLHRLLGDPVSLKRMGEAAHRSVKDRDWSNAFARFWAMTDDSSDP